jgi:hypothetical protein
MLPSDAYERAVAAQRELVEELNESTGENVKVSSQYILVLARKP